MCAKPVSPADQVSPSVQALIARLRDEGVAAGQAQAEQIVAEAEADARAIVEKAEQEAQARIEAAHREAENLKTAADEALEVAARDAVLTMKTQLAEHFAADVGRLVAKAMDDEDLLRRMILEVVGRAREDAALPEAEPVEVLLPRDIVGLDELRRDPAELQEGTLTRFVLAQTGRMLKQGVTFGVATDGARGIRIIARDHDITIDLTDQAVAAVILQHLQPRFRALLEGIVK